MMSSRLFAARTCVLLPSLPFLLRSLFLRSSSLHVIGILTVIVFISVVISILGVITGVSTTRGHLPSLECGFGDMWLT